MVEFRYIWSYAGAPHRGKCAGGRGGGNGPVCHFREIIGIVKEGLINCAVVEEAEDDNVDYYIGYWCDSDYPRHRL